MEGEQSILDNWKLKLDAHKSVLPVWEIGMVLPFPIVIFPTHCSQ